MLNLLDSLTKGQYLAGGSAAAAASAGSAAAAAAGKRRFQARRHVPCGHVRRTALRAAWQGCSAGDPT